MEKLYISYIPKSRGEFTDFKIVQSLQKCMKYYTGKNNIVSSPGFLSTSPYVKQFVNEFKKIVPFNNKIFIGFFRGMSSKQTPLGSYAIIDEHYDELLKTGLFNKLKIKISNKLDHRKMIFIFGIKNESIFDFEEEELNKESKERFLKSIIVNAVFIGSSNQSYNTYYGGNSRKADKGEADVLLFVIDDNTKLIMESMYVEGTVVFQELLGNNKMPHEYLLEIFDNFLSESLQ